MGGGSPGCACDHSGFGWGAVSALDQIRIQTGWLIASHLLVSATTTAAAATTAAFTLRVCLVLIFIEARSISKS